MNRFSRALVPSRVLPRTPLQRPPAPAASSRPTAPAVRLVGFDALKALTTVLVVFHHAAITYGAQGGWFYRERPAGDDLQSVLLTAFCALNQAWFMGLFFLLAGYFTPAALERKGISGFVRDRALRLGLPTLVFAVAIGPPTIALVQTVVNGRDPAEVFASLWARGAWEPGPLWFAQALLGFSLVAAAAWPRLQRRPAPPIGHPAVPEPGRLLALAVATGAAAFVLRLVWPVGQSVAGMQFGHFASYVVLFALGVLGARTRALQRIPEATARRLRRVAIVAAPTLLPLVLLASVFPVFAASAAGGWTLPALMTAFWEPLVAAGTIAVLLRASLARLSTPPPWLERLSRRAYCVYAIHAPVLVAIALAMRPLEAPALLKFVVLGTLATAICHVLAGMILRWPPANRVL